MNLGRIASSLVGQTTAEFFNKLMPLLILHFVAHKLGASEFGYAKFSFEIIDIAITLVVFGYASVAAIDIGQTTGNVDNVRAVVWETIYLKLAHALLVAIALFFVVSNRFTFVARENFRSEFTYTYYEM